MNRDIKLLVKILRYVRDNANGVDPIENPDVNGRDRAEVSYHVGLGIDAGFIDGKTFDDSQGYRRSYLIWGLTWKGHDEVEKHTDC